MDILVMVAQMLLGLSILVGLHEMGHMLAAKFFGMKVEKFSIGFPPKIFAFKKGDTEYSLGAIPLGGFVKIAGMVDEHFDTDRLKEPPKEWEFRSKPAWQRLIVMMGGIIVNVVTGIFVFIALVYFLGETYYATSEANKYGIWAYELGEKMGLKTGDKLTAVNGFEPENFFDFKDPNYLLEGDSYYTVDRDGKSIDLPIPNDLLDQLSDGVNSQPLFDILTPFKVGRVRKGYPAFEAGLKSGDKILSLNGQNVEYFHPFKNELGKNKGKEVNLVVLRDGKEIPIKVKVTEEGLIGFSPVSMLIQSKKLYSFPQAIATGTTNAFDVIFVQLKAFKKIFAGEVSPTKSISGPIGIAQVFGSDWNWIRFWSICGVLSMVLAFMNLLPIPVLDGGHVLFLLYEMIAGRAVPVAFLETAQRIGAVLIFMLLAFAFGNDIYKLFLP